MRVGRLYFGGMMRSLFWGSRRVLVTGGAGFLGSHIVRLLKSLGACVYVPRSSKYDLTTESGASRLFIDHPADIVIHAAGYVGGILANQQEPGTMFYRNAMMGLNVLEQCRRHNVAKAVYIGTVCSYPLHAIVPFKESDLWEGYPERTNGPYGMAKKLHLVQAQANYAQFGTDTAYLLMANLYGPGDHSDPQRSHFVPALIKRVLNASEMGLESICLWGTGKATRDLLYVEDAAEAILRAAEHYKSPDPVNIGTGRSYSIAEVAATIAATIGYRGRIEWDHSKPDGQPNRGLDVSLADREFGWRARTPLSAGLARTISYFRAIS